VTAATPAPGVRRRGVTAQGWLSRIEWFDRVGSTNDVVADRLRSGTPEVYIAIADEQTAGRGRDGRAWTAPAGAALLLSAGFTPGWLEPERHWQLAAIVSVAMAQACETAVGLATGTVRLKWPNDLVIVDEASRTVRKLAGVLGVTEGLGTSAPRAVIGIGVNVNWPRAAFPPELAASMTSLDEVAPGRAIDRDDLLDAFLSALAPRFEALRERVFPAAAWRERQVTSGSPVHVEWPDGTSEELLAIDVDPATGALLVQPPGEAGPARSVIVGEIRHLRVVGGV
jgi:BirA family biotin operon repressor/biotin-[acetyl-CoA-carboxylase] ligase